MKLEDILKGKENIHHVLNMGQSSAVVHVDPTQAYLEIDGVRISYSSSGTAGDGITELTRAYSGYLGKLSSFRSKVDADTVDHVEAISNYDRISMFVFNGKLTHTVTNLWNLLRYKATLYGRISNLLDKLDEVKESYQISLDVLAYGRETTSNGELVDVSTRISNIYEALIKKIDKKKELLVREYNLFSDDVWNYVLNLFGSKRKQIVL